MRVITFCAVLIAAAAVLWYWQHHVPAPRPAASTSPPSAAERRSATAEPHRGGASRSVRGALADGAAHGATPRSTFETSPLVRAPESVPAEPQSRPPAPADRAQSLAGL